MERKLRHLQNNLVIAGTGLMAFTFWNIIRVLLFLVTYRSELKEYIQSLAEEEGTEIPPILVYLVLILIVVLVSLPYIIIGKSARTDGMGKKKKTFFIVLAVIMLIPQALIAIFSISEVFDAGEALIEALITALIDLTTFCVLMETVITAILVKKYRKLLSAGGAK